MAMELTFEAFDII